MKKKIIWITAAIAVVVVAVIAIVGLVHNHKKNQPDAPYTVKAVVKQLPETTIDYLDYIEVYAANGCDGYPENSLEAIRVALDMEPKALELDLAFREDGTPVLAKNYDEAQNAMVTLEDAIQLIAEAPKTGVYLYVREISNVRGAVAVLDNAGISNRVRFLCDSEAVVDYLEQEGVSIPCIFVLSNDNVLSYGNERMLKHVKKLTEKNISTFAVTMSDVSQSQLELLQTDGGANLLCYHVETESDAVKALSSRLNVMTNRPDLYKRCIDGWRWVLMGNGVNELEG